jgi:hypothetical protein
MKKLLPILLCIILSISSKANYSDTTIKSPVKLFDKTILLGTDFQGRILVGLSTPQMLFRTSKTFQIGPAFFPLFWWDYKTGEMDTKMGVGARADYKRHIFAFNTFKVGKVWNGAIMLGIKF